MENTNALTKIETETPAPAPSLPTVAVNLAIFDDSKFTRMYELAKIMASGKCTIPKHLQGNPGDCFAVIMQSMQWGMTPFAVAQKTHVVNGSLGYEAQLVNAVVSATGAISGRFHYEYCGEWDAYRASGFNKSKEAGCGVNVGAVIRGETEIRWLPMPIFMETVKTRNSPLWAVNPMQQLAYLAVKFWARLYTPDAILGIYSDDELADSEPINVTHAAQPDAKPEKSKTELLAEKLGASTSEAAKTEAQNDTGIVRLIEMALERAGLTLTVADCEKWLREKKVLKDDQTLDKDFDAIPADWKAYLRGKTASFVAKVAEETAK